MADKNGTVDQRRNALFSNNPVKGMGICPFKSTHIAIVPMRYALDRSRYDVDPARLTPLDAQGKWAKHPALKTRQYTLRQLRDGMLYVYDETDDLLYEYLFEPFHARLTRTAWEGSEPGPDFHATEGPGGTHLLFPRTHTLRLAFSAHRWSGKMCEHMRTSPLKRNAWMRTLDLRDYSHSMSVPHALPLERLQDRVVADVDPYPINHDGRFADSAHPPTVPEGAGNEPLCLAADVVWRGTVNDCPSAVMIALDDPLAMLEDLGMQLAADQAALLAFQAEHEHALNIAGVVEHLCGFAGDHALMPETVRNDEVKTRQFIEEIDAYFEQLRVEDDVYVGQLVVVEGVVERPSRAMTENFERRYGSLPDPELRKRWQDRSKWRREVDLEAALEYRHKWQTELRSVTQTIQDTRQDILILGQHIGTDPMKLFIDTTDSTSLLCLLEITADLMCNLSQDTAFSRWLLAEEQQPTTLFGLARFGFSETLKQALTEEANRLMNGVSDINALIGRAGEINNLLNHDTIAQQPWMKALSETAQQTLNALTYLAGNLGKSALQGIQLALLSVDSRLAQSKTGQQVIMLRNLTIGQIFFNSADRLHIDTVFAQKVKDWEAEGKRLSNEVSQANKRGQQPVPRHNRKALMHQLSELNQRIKAHELIRPQLIDFANNGYLRTLQEKTARGYRNYSQVTQTLSENAKSLIKDYGLNASAITWGIAAANLYNTVVTYELASRDGELNQKDWAKVGSASAYTGSAIMAIFVETAWPGIKGLAAVVGGKNMPITGMSARYWASRGGEFKNWGRLIQGFGARLVGLGGLAVMAAGLELWDVLDDRNKTKSAQDKSFLTLKAGAVFGFAAVGAAQLFAGVPGLAGFGMLMPYVMTVWLAAFSFVFGLVYLFATYALNSLKRDAIGQWLRQCRWGRHLEERFGDNNEEIGTFLELQLSPSLFVKPSFEMPSFLQSLVDPRPILNGAWIQLRIPAALRGESVQLDLTTSSRSMGMPVELLGGSLKDEFIKQGRTESEDKWGVIPAESSDLVDIAPLHKMLGREDQHIIWQTWIPLDKGVEYLEMQVWYSTDFLAAVEGDKGYRYQMELVKGGIFDGSENSVSGSNSRIFLVEKLGGRMTSASLYFPW